MRYWSEKSLIPSPGTLGRMTAIAGELITSKVVGFFQRERDDDSEAHPDSVISELLELPPDTTISIE